MTCLLGSVEPRKLAYQLGYAACRTTPKWFPLPELGWSPLPELRWYRLPDPIPPSPPNVGGSLCPSWTGTHSPVSDSDSDTTELLRFHYHQNALGSVSEISAPGGGVIEWVTYDVYGKATVRNSAGTTQGSSYVGNPFLFTGREWDGASGTYHYRARAYDPEAGRFLQRDPLGLTEGLNLYRYVRCNPVTHADPSGLKDPDDPKFPGTPGSVYSDAEKAKIRKKIERGKARKG